MNIKLKWYRGISQFIHSILRIKSSCHTNLEHIITKGTKIADYVYITGFSILKFCYFALLDCYISKLSLQFKDTSLQSSKGFTL